MMIVNTSRKGNRACFVVSILFLMMAQRAAAVPVGEYEGWLWENGTFGAADGLIEEFCFAAVELSIAPDANWTASVPDDVCWGRTTVFLGRIFFNSPPFSAETSDPTQSTQPLKSAGGNLYEFYGQDFEEGVGQGEQRLAALLATPTEEDLLVIGGYFGFDNVSGEYGANRFLDVAAKSSAAVKAARTAVDLENTNWRIGVLTHTLNDSNVNVEVTFALISSLNLGVGGACSFAVSGVFPSVVDNGDLFRAIQFDDGVSFDDRTVRGGLDSHAVSNCSYAIDADDYLVVTYTDTPASNPGNSGVVVRQYVVSDNNRYLVPAPAATLEDNSRALVVGYRAAAALPATALNHDYLFYLALNEFGADGAGAAAAGFGDRNWQEYEGFGRGRISFNSAVAGTTPAGEGGSWSACDADMTFGEFVHELTGNAGMASVAVGGVNIGSNNIAFTDCSFQLAANGALNVYLEVIDPSPDDDGFQGILRGYVNETGDLLTLLQNVVDGDPANPGNVNKDAADIKFLLGVRYSGDLNADADNDGYSNYEEFRLPLPTFPIVDQDADGNSTSDILFRNSVTGANQLYLMFGTTIVENLSVSTVAASWQLVGRGDYNGDGKSDILWRYTPTGALWIYTMNGSAVTSSKFVGTIADSNWKIVGNGDYNGDGKSDILWHHAVSGTVWLYEMDNNIVTASTGIGVVPNIDWKIVGSGDYNGDGRSDVLWRNAVTGTNWMYLMNGSTIATSIGISVTPDLNWAIVGNGDYNGDGKSDILWRHATLGTNWLYLMNGTAIATSASISVLPDSNWKIVGDGDYNGDGKADVLWRNMSTGANRMYLMNGLAITSNTAVSTVTDQNWQIVNTR